jgi:Pentapeptide repeats (8 copies)
MRMNTDREHSEQQTKQSRWGFRGKTVWNWMELLIVPLALAVIGLAFSVQQDARQQRVENQRAEAERELAVQRAQDEALQAYLDQMSTLLLEKDLRDSEAGSEVRTLALARTPTVLERLDPSRKSELMQFLLEADLVEGLDGRDQIIELGTADLKGANLTGAVMPFAYLSGANLRGAEGFTNEEIEQEASSLEGATMPNGQKYDDWLNDR